MKASASCVWASCCGLLNEVMGAGAVRGQHPGFGGAGPFRFAPSAGYSTHTNTHTHNYTHTNPHTHTHTHTLSCQSCRENFSIFRRRYGCSECGRSFCSMCSVVQENLRMCCTCNLLKGTAFQRSRLMKLRIKDLRRYLTLRNINTNTCREKDDLVNLVLYHRGLESQEDSDTPTFPRRPLYTPPTTDSAPLLSSAQEEPISRDDGSVSTSEQLVDSASLFTREPTEPTPEVVQRAGRASLSDLSCVEEVEQLTVRQLKEILTRNFVNFSGCCEKWELMERVRRLYTEKQHLENESHDVSTDGRSARLAVDENLCRICMDAAIDCVLLECGHMVTCTKCGKRMSECPICRQYVIRAVHVFRS